MIDIKKRLRNMYQIIRYGAIQQPLPDFSRYRHVVLHGVQMDGGGGYDFGAWDRETQELAIFDGYYLTGAELTSIQAKAAATKKAAIWIPLAHDLRIPREEYL